MKQANENSSIEISENGNAILKIFVKSLDMYSATKVRSLVKLIFEEEEFNNFIIEMTPVESIDSSGIAMLAFISTSQRRKGGSVYTVGLNSKVEQILVISSMMDFFKNSSDIKSVDRNV